MSTPAPAATRGDTTEPPGTSKTPAPTPATPDLIRWPEPVVATLAIAGVLIIVGATIWPQPLLVAAGIGIAAATIGVAILCVRGNQRRSMVAHLANKAAAHLKTPLLPVRAHWGWRGWPGQLTVLMVRYPASALAAMGDDTARRIASALSTAAGPERAATVKRHWASRHRVTIRFRTTDPNADTPDAAEQRVADVVTDTVGSNGHPVDITTNDTGDIASFAIAMTKAARFTEASVQRRLSKAVTSRLDGRWKINFNLQNDRIEFTRRVPLPTSIARPVIPLTADNATKIPEAIDEDGEVHWWNVSGVLAHHLRAGRTRTGKTVAMAGDLVEAARRDWQVFVIDPKRIEFMGWRGWPNVAMVATRLEDQVALIEHLHSLMEERYRLIEEEDATEADFHRVLVIIDEYRQFYALVKAWWSTIKVQGMPSECPTFEQVGSLLRMAAAARIHLLVATQRPDAEFLRGEARDNYSARSATGRLSPDGAQMMFDSQHIGVSTPEIQGRGTIVGLDDQPKEVQFYYTPNPRKASTEEERQLLRQLRPTTTAWPPQAFSFPEADSVQADIAASDRKTAVEWEQIRQARLGPATTDTAPAASSDAPSVAIIDRPATVPSRLRRSTLSTADTREGPAATASSRSEQDPHEEYAPPQRQRPAELTVGDLVELDGKWVCVHEPAEPAGDDLVEITWRDNDDNIETTAVSDDETVNSRRPTEGN